jgi:hypothetical protein
MHHLTLAFLHGSNFFFQPKHSKHWILGVEENLAIKRAFEKP